MARTQKELELSCVEEYRLGVQMAYDLCYNLYNDKILLPDSDDVGINALETYILRNLYVAKESLELVNKQIGFLKNKMQEA